MTKKSTITLFLIALLFASCGTRKGNNAEQTSNTFDEGVVINGLRWATRNVDAPGTFAPYPESFGMYFQWNRKKGWDATGETLLGMGWDAVNEEGTAWYAENDPCPKGWRVPTRDELRSLADVDNEWTIQNGIYGRLFGTAPHQIFLPAAGYHRITSDFKSSAVWVGRVGIYWSSTQFEPNFISDNDYAERLNIENWGNSVFPSPRRAAYSVRCVSIN